MIKRIFLFCVVMHAPIFSMNNELFIKWYQCQRTMRNPSEYRIIILPGFISYEDEGYLKAVQDKEYADELAELGLSYKKNYSTAVVQGNIDAIELYAAVKNGSIREFKELLSTRSVDINEKYHDGDNLLHIALKLKKKKIVFCLLYCVSCGISPFVRDKNGATPLYLAVKQEHKGFSETLLEKGMGDCCELIHYLVSKELKSELENYLQYHRNGINQEDIFGKTPLHIAVQKNNLEIVQLLLRYKARSKIFDFFGNTPVHVAAKLGRAELLQEFKSHGVNFFSKNKQGQTVYDLIKQKQLADKKQIEGLMSCAFF